MDNNAKCFLDIIKEYGSFDDYLWSHTDYKTYIYVKHQNGYGEAKNDLSDMISRDLKKRGFKYLGSITIYSHLQACGIINDHEQDCWMYKKIVSKRNVIYL